MSTEGPVRAKPNGRSGADSDVASEAVVVAPAEGVVTQEVVERKASASQWELVWWKFRKHRLAVVSLVVVGLFYLTVVFAEFFAPYDPRIMNVEYREMPPSRIHFVDVDGRFHLRPFVYARTQRMNPHSLRMEYQEDTGVRYPLRLFVRGDTYELWGLIPGNLHLFGIREEGVRVCLFGADRNGRDLLSRVVYGTRISLTIGLIGVFLSFFLGILLGGISGYYGGVVDTIIQRIIEFLRSLPTLPLWMGLSAALPPTWPMLRIYFGIVLILSLLSWTSIARVVRGKFLSLRDEDFIVSARLDGERDLSILFRYLLPSFMSHIIAAISLQIPAMILGETALSFIGLGLQAPAISWGVLLKDAQSISVLATMPWLLIPGIFVVVVIIAFNFVGDGLRDAADPYSEH